MNRNRSRLSQGAPHLAAPESPGEHLDAVAQDDRHPIPEGAVEPGLVDVDRLHGVPPPAGGLGDDRIHLRAQHTGLPGEEKEVAHCGSVPRVRPGTTIAILLLIGLLLIAGVLFVIRLTSVT